MKLAVVGLGKIGFPIAMQAASKGVEVIGCDINSEVVSMVNSGENHIKEEPGVGELLTKALAEKKFQATTDVVSGVSSADIVIIVVPLVVDKDKNVDYSIIDKATETVAEGLTKDTLVIYETTLPVGDTRGRMASILEKSGLSAGKDFQLAFSPERVYTGQVLRDLKEYPKIVGGIDEKSLLNVVAFYNKILDAEVIPVKNTETAEFVKIMGMTYRDVNIGLANEFAKFADKKGIDISDATRACNTNPNAHVLRPGVGVGGHCAPVYPYFIINEGKKMGARILLAENAREINDGMGDYSVKLVDSCVGGLSGKTVLILGLAFRENVKETAFTTTTFLIESITNRGGKVLIHDPWFSDKEISEYGTPAPRDLSVVSGVDAVIVQAYHDEYKTVDYSVFKKAGCVCVLDGRNSLSRERIESAGLKYLGIGRLTS